MYIQLLGSSRPLVFRSISDRTQQVGKCCPQGRDYSPLFLQRARWRFFILWMLVGTSLVSIQSSLFSFVCTYSVWLFGRMLVSMYFAALLLRTKFFFCTSWDTQRLGVVFVCSCYSCAYTLYHVYLFIINKQCWLPLHIHYSP